MSAVSSPLVLSSPPAAQGVTRRLAGWGNYPIQECRVYRPERTAELLATYAGRDSHDYIPRGLGRSYGDAALNAGGGVVLHEKLDRFLAFDPATGAVECEAGVTIADLIDAFLPRGWFIPVTPGTKYVTLGGAVAANVHGKNHHRDGAIVEFVDGFDLLVADGSVLRCSRAENADAFWATVGGMGLTGAILIVRLRLRRVESAYFTVDYVQAPDLDRALEVFAATEQRYRYSVAWVDCLAGGLSLGRSVVMNGISTPLADLPDGLRADPLALAPAPRKAVPFNFPGFTLNALSVRLFNDLYYDRNATGRRVVSYEQFFYPLDSVLHWNRIYGRRGFVQYQAVLPPDAARGGLVAMLQKLAASRRASFLAVLKSMGPADEGLLSFPARGQTLALDLPYTGRALLELLRELDRIVLDHGGRVYLAKDATLDRRAFERMYPKLDQFRQAKARLDPDNRFSSSLSRRLGIGGAK